MNLQEVTNYVEQRAKSEKALGGILKFKFPEGYIWIDGTSDVNLISNESNKDPDCTLTMKLSTFDKLRSKKMNGMTAYMLGKVKFKGDAKVAMKLMNII